MITEMHWWEKAKLDNYHLKKVNGDDNSIHREPVEYDNDVIKDRVKKITDLFRGNEKQIFTLIIGRIKKTATLSKDKMTDNEKYRLHFIANNYLELTNENEIDKIDDDIFYALLEDITCNMKEVSHNLSALKPLIMHPLPKQLACIRSGAIEFLYEILVEAFELSKVTELKHFLGIPVNTGPLTSTTFGVGIYHALNKMTEWMPSWGAIALVSGLSTLATIVPYCTNYIRINGYCTRPENPTYESLEDGGNNILANQDRPLTHAEKDALAKRFGWKVTMLFTIYLASIKIAIQHYTDDTVEEFFNKHTGGVMPPGSLDYIVIMITHAVTKSALRQLHIRSDK